MEKAVELERATDADGQPGSFGFSIMGGFGTKFPSCVCEVDTGGPADRTNKVLVGDRLILLNGEELDKLSSRDLVQRIRNAPSPSTFVLLEDEDLRQQILAVLRKRERRAADKARRDRLASTGSEGSAGSVEPVPAKNRRKTPPAFMHEGGPVSGGEDKRKKRLDKIMEAEPGGIPNGQSGIPQMQHHRVSGRLENTEPTSSTSTSRQSPARSSPLSSAERLSPLRGSPGRDRRDSRSTSTSPSRSHKQAQSDLPPSSSDLLPSTSTPLSNYQSTPNISLDSLSSSSSSHGGGTNSLERNPNRLLVSSRSAEQVNGEADFSEQNSVEGTPNSGSSTSFDDKPYKMEEGAGEGVIRRVAQPSRVPVTDQDNCTNTLPIPEWNGHLLQSNLEKKPRSSLSEDILIGELERSERRDMDPPAASEDADAASSNSSSSGRARVGSHGDRPSAKEGSSTPEEQEGTRSGSFSKIVRRKSSKKKDQYTNAVMMARKLFMLDGFKKSEVASKLSDRSEFGQSVAKEYLTFFEFQGLALEDSLRQFLSCFSLTGESQERERIMIHFSRRYHECNPHAYRSADEVHGVTVALLLLNTDLHSQHSGKKMTLSQFSSNLESIDVQLHKETIKLLYDGIRKHPLEWAKDDEDRSPPSSTQHEGISSDSPNSEVERVYHVTIPGTFVEVEMPENAPLFKEGYVLRKNIMEGPHKKVSRGKRQWKPYYAYLKGFLLYLERPRGGDLHLENTSSAISICHCLAMGAFDYHKKNSVLRVTTSEWQCFLLQANDTMDMQQWITAINKAAATYSAAPLAAPVSSSVTLQRPTYPMAPTKYGLEQQGQEHEARVKSIGKELEEHQAYKPKGSKAKHNELKAWFDKYEFLQFEINRFQIYYASLTSNLPIEFNAPLPSGLVPSPSISTLATPGSSELTAWKSRTPPQSPPSRHKLGSQDKKRSTNSPLLSSKGNHS